LKKKSNRAIKALKNLLDMERNREIQEYLSKVNVSSEINYSLWKAIKSLKRPDISSIYQEAGWELGEK